MTMLKLCFECKKHCDISMRMMILLFSMKIIYANGITERDYDYDWKCVPVKMEFCKDIEYNQTIDMEAGVPNHYIDKTNQEEIKTDLSHFQPLIEAGCSKHLRLLLCSVYVPYCNVKANKVLITACRSLCEDVKRKCLNLMKKFDFEWPDSLTCSKFPRFLESKMCVNAGIIEPTKTTQRAPATFNIKKKTKVKDNQVDMFTKNNKIITKVLSSRTYCQDLYNKHGENYFFVQKIMSCALECAKDGLFTFEEKEIVEKWISTLSCCCCLLCVFALFVVVSEYHKILYPEKTIIFITVSYTFYSIAHIIRVVYSRESISCQEEHGRRYLISDGSGNIACATTFLLTYCFYMAQNIWWVFLALSWFLCSGLKWKQQTIITKSTYFHVIAWGIPSAMTIVILVIRKIDVNELTGMCSIGNRYENLTALSGFMLGPLFTYLITGIVFLLFGVYALFRLSSNSTIFTKSRTKTEYGAILDGAFAILHATLSIFVLSSYFYEYFNKSSWYNDKYSSGPNFQIFFGRVIMEFMIGIVSSAWLLLMHAPTAYKRLKRKLRVPRDPLLGETQPFRTNQTIPTSETSI